MVSMTEYQGEYKRLRALYNRGMAFNHYAKMKRILDDYEQWYIVRVNRPTTSTGFNGELRTFDHYYRVYSAVGEPIKFCKFQQIDRFASVMNCAVEALLIIEE